MIVPIIEDVGVKGAQPATDMSSSSELPLYSKASAQHEPAVVPVQRSSALNESDCDDELDEFLLNLSGAPDDAMLNKLTKKLMGDKEPSSPAVASVTTTTKTDVVVSLPKPIQVTESIIMKTPGKIIVKPPPTTERGSPKNVPAKLMPRPPTPEWMKAATQNLVRTKKQ